MERDYVNLFKKPGGIAEGVLGVVLDNTPSTREHLKTVDLMNDSSTKLVLIKATNELDVAAEEIINSFNNDASTNYKIEKVYGSDHGTGKFYTAVEFVPNVETIKLFIQRNSPDDFANKIDPYSLAKSAVISLLTDNIDMHYENALVKNVGGKNHVVLIDPMIKIGAFANTRKDFIGSVANGNWQKAKNLLINSNPKDWTIIKSTGKKITRPIMRFGNKEAVSIAIGRLREKDLINIIKELTVDSKINKITLNAQNHAVNKDKMKELANNVMNNFQDLKQSYQNLDRKDKPKSLISLRSIEKFSTRVKEFLTRVVRGQSLRKKRTK